MFPIGDERVQGGPPAFVTYGLIALNVLAFMSCTRQSTTRITDINR